MSVSVLYLTTVLIWGTTWLAIKYQIGIVPLEVSIAYRFILASIILFAFVRIKKIKIKLKLKQHLRVFAMGIFIFCLNYICTYYASKHLPSGLVAVVFATIPSVNIINSRIFLGHKPNGALIIGVIAGLVGILLVFYDDLLKLNSSHETLFGLGIAFTGTTMASLGNILSTSNQQRGISIVAANAYGMMYGGLLTLAIGLAKGETLAFDPSISYIVSLLYLSVFGSIIAFGSYFSLLKKIGPSRASYSAVLFPIVALTLSTIFENYQWQLTAVIGVLIILAGNMFIMKNIRKT
jgi:drug/metabolite transporter (DMT)-like permease